MGLFLLESEEKLVLWLFVMEGSFVGEKGIPEAGLCQTLSPSARLLCCAYITALCSGSSTSKGEGQCSPWLIPGTWAVPVNLQVYETASSVICTKKKEDSFKLNT